MGEHILGYQGIQIIRQNAGSPNSWYKFDTISESVMIDNLGSSAIYFCFNSGAEYASSGTGYLDANRTLVFDAKIGSVSILASGLTTPSVQVFRLT